MIISNSTPLIYLAKIGRLHLLRDLFRKIIIPLEVKQEVVDAGKKINKRDAFIIEKEIANGWIEVKENAKQLDIPFDIHLGEKAVIALACTLNVKMVLIDERAARVTALLHDLTPRGTLYVLIKSLERGLLTFESFLATIDQLAQEGFRLQEEVYTKVIRKALELSKK